MVKQSPGVSLSRRAAAVPGDTIVRLAIFMLIPGTCFKIKFLPSCLQYCHV
jgi:hypothetical protein